MWSKSQKHNRSAGFSLAEVLVALVIAAMMAGMLTRFVAGTRSNAGKVGEALELTALGETVLGRVPLGQSWSPGRTDGRAGAYTWRVDVTPIAATADARIIAKKEAPKDVSKPDKNMLSALKLDTSDFGTREKTVPQTRPTHKWTLYRVVVTVLAPSGRKYATETIRIGQDAAGE